MTKFAVIGAGQVGRNIAAALLAAGHSVVFGARNLASENVKKALADLPRTTAALTEDAVRASDIAVLATAYPDAVPTVAALASALEGKILLDTTNPVGPGLEHGEGNKSGTELLQAAAPKSFVVKAFSTIYTEHHASPSFPGYGSLLPTNPIAGDNAEAKKTVTALLQSLGWEVFDAGNAHDALHLEHITLIFIKQIYVYGNNRNWTLGLLRK